LFALAPVALTLAACATLQRGPVGNRSVPQPAKPVELDRYLGTWYEVGRYENGFEKGCAGVTAEYSLREDGLIRVVNSCRVGGLNGRLKQSIGKAKVVSPANNKLKVSFFGPFWGNYWVLDRGEEYDWAIVGEPSGRYLWLLARQPGAEVTDALVKRAGQLGYDTAMIHRTAQAR
jgi:apolipoprotein D and lipocalin family protein